MQEEENARIKKTISKTVWETVLVNRIMSASVPLALWINRLHN